MIDLTRTESLILARLQAAPGRTIHHELLLPCVRGRTLDALRVHVCRLRAKGVAIRTVWGTGYQLVA